MVMRKITQVLTTFSVVVFSMCSYAQVYVSNNSFVYNRGSMIYSTGNVELNGANSNMYLRNEGQLLQGGIGAGTNLGLGALSVFQEGTQNNFGYNYWCSPVGVSAAAVGNSSFILSQVVKRPTGLTAFQTPTFITGLNGTSTPAALTISSYWIFQYSVANNYSAWSSVGGAGSVIPGLGFTMKGVSGSDNTDVGEVALNNPGSSQRYDFRGKPNEGNINIAVGNTAGPDYPNRTLTGNPYPSAINLNLFLLENSGYNVNYTTGVVTVGGPTNVINGNAYFWEHQKPATSHFLNAYVGGYGTYVPNNVNAFSPGTYNNAPWNTYNPDGTPNTFGAPAGTERYKRMFTPVAQGFKIQGTVVAGNAIMRNRYRAFVKEGVANNSEFERMAAPQIGDANWEDIQNVAGVDYTQFSKNQVPQIKLHITFNNEYTKEVTMAFNPNTTDGYDVAMDAQSSQQTDAVDAYFPIDQVPYVITTLPFDINKRIPFAFKSDVQTAVKVQVGQIINFDQANKVYIHDKVTDMYYDIKSDYFLLNVNNSVIDNRYEVTFIANSLGDSSTIKEVLSVVQNNEKQTLTIFNPSVVSIKSATMYDISGKLVLQKVDLESKESYDISTSTLSEGVYIINVLDVNGEKFAQKVIVERVE